MKATKGKIIVTKDIKKEKTTASGLVVIDSDTHGKFVETTIVSVGEGITSVTKGQKVLTMDGVGINFDGPDGVTYYLLNEDDIDAIIE